MITDKKLNLLGQLMLLIATLAWGTSFFILKETIHEVPEFYVLAIRFLLAGTALALVFFKRIKNINKGSFLRGFILGLVLFCAYTVQTFGLSYTTPSRNAFLTAAYCVIVPFMAWGITKKSPKIYNLIAAFACIVGIGFVAFSGESENGSNVLLGDALTLLGAVFYALQIIFVDGFQKKNDDSAQLLVVQVSTVGVLCLISSLIFELPVNGIEGYALNIDQIVKIGYLTIACTMLAQLCQIFGQKYTTANQASLILSLEAVFGTFFSVLLGNEMLTAQLIIGFAIIFVAVMINEFKFDPVKLLKGKKSI